MKVLNLNRILLFFFAFGTTLSAQHLNIAPTYHQNTLELNKNYYSDYHKDSINITTLKFYIGKIHFYKNGKLIKYSSQYFLVDMAKPKSLQLELDPPSDYDVITFDLGVDSITNNSGAMSGDLDPANNMYWSWQSGYINFKLEGTSPICPARKNKFQFHLGGYIGEVNSVVEVRVKKISTEIKSVNTNKTFPLGEGVEEHVMDEFNQSSLVFNLAPFFSSINIREIYQVMSPSEKAVQIAKDVSTLFSLTL